MKIAFVGKGGSGKSTLAALFIDHLRKMEAPLIAVDADINIHLPDLIGARFDHSNALSRQENAAEIKKYLKGENPFVDDAANIVKTTPPSKKSNYLFLNDQNELIAKYATKFADDAYFFHVGTYEKEGIGKSCYHGALAIFESILSHSLLTEDEYLVADMVAGTDAFAGSLHAQFDAIFLVVEPTPEGVEVYKQCVQLAKAAGVLDYIYVIGNKVDDVDDVNYLNEAIGEKMIGWVPRRSDLKRARQKGEMISSDSVEGLQTLFENVISLARTNYRKQDERLQLLHDLHKELTQLAYIISRHGDISDQIDPEFSYFADFTEARKRQMAT